MKYKLSGGTTKPAGHLQKHHSTKLNLRVPTASPIVSGLINAAKQLDQQKFNQKVADDMLLRWIIHTNVPFSMTSYSRFRVLLLYLNDYNQLPRSSTTITQRILAHFRGLQPHVAKLMQQAITPIHLSCDGWTSPHQTMAVLGVIAHFTSKAGIRMNHIIGLCSLEGSHTGSNMAEVIMEILWEYGVEEKLRYIIGDNATNNASPVRALGDEELHGTYRYDAEEHWLRCVGHVINLAFQAFLFGDVDHTLWKDTVIVTHDTMGEWRKMGPWGKAHNITIYVLASPQRRQEFKRLGGTTILHRVNATWWNTGYTMIQRIIRNWDAVEVSCQCHADYLDSDRLSVDDSEQLADAVSILEPFHAATLRMQGDFSELHNILVELDFLRTMFTTVLQQYHGNPHLDVQRASADGIVVLDKYRELYKELTVFVAAVVLHPAYKWEYLAVAVDKLEWTEDQLRDAKLRVQALWLIKYVTVSAIGASAGERQPDPPPAAATPDAIWRALRQRVIISTDLSPSNLLIEL